MYHSDESSPDRRRPGGGPGFGLLAVAAVAPAAAGRVGLAGAGSACSAPRPVWGSPRSDLRPRPARCPTCSRPRRHAITSSRRWSACTWPSSSPAPRSGCSRGSTSRSPWPTSAPSRLPSGPASTSSSSTARPSMSRSSRPPCLPRPTASRPPPGSQPRTSAGSGTGSTVKALHPSIRDPSQETRSHDPSTTLIQRRVLRTHSCALFNSFFPGRARART